MTCEKCKRSQELDDIIAAVNHTYNMYIKGHYIKKQRIMNALESAYIKGKIEGGSNKDPKHT